MRNNERQRDHYQGIDNGILLFFVVIGIERVRYSIKGSGRSVLYENFTQKVPWARSRGAGSWGEYPLTRGGLEVKTKGLMFDVGQDNGLVFLL